MVNNKFIPPFIKFVNKHFNQTKHLFFLIGNASNEYEMDPSIENVVWVESENQFVLLQIYLNKADKILLHGLYDLRIKQILFNQPWILKKCFWLMWGGDLYFPEKQTWLHKQIIKNVKNVVTFIKQDYQYLIDNYKVYPKLYTSFCYLSNVFNEDLYKTIFTMPKNEIWLLVGNSADYTNRHEFIFDKLQHLINKNIKLITPLSYSFGDGNYRKKIIDLGYKLFGDKFNPLLEFLPYQDYLKILANIDIAIFAHERQEALGNIIQLLGLGKKVYLSKNSPLWKHFSEAGIKLYDINNDINLTVNQSELEHNKKIIKECYTEENLKKQLFEIFYK
jgi:hypothetical protein